MTELCEKLEREVLPLVSRPSRYTGGERNVPETDPDGVELSFLLAFPDVYEIGMSHLGIRVLYDILSRRPEVAVERVFAPWVDMERLMREKDVPLFSLESCTAAREFDVIGFTLQYELHYTEVLTMLDLAGVPLRAADRSEGEPYIVGGGPCAYNPEPVAAFFDLLVMGDGESAVVELTDVLLEARHLGLTRDETLRRCAALRGVYVPSLYEERFAPPSGEGAGPGGSPSDDGQGGSGGDEVPGGPGASHGGVFVGTLPVDDAAPPRVERRVEASLSYAYHPTSPIVPATEATHDRLAIEIMRGCTRGCRFCQAGMVTRPVRECPMEDVARLVREGIASSGHDEVSLVSLSASDHSELGKLVPLLNEELFERRVSISLPSLRADRFGLELADGIGRVRKSGLTFAPEAGSQRLRDVINKNETEDAVIETVDTAFSAGWKRVKLYFMIGLPTETDEDLDAIGDLVRRVRETARRHRRGAAINVSISPFVPKSHTPFQWERQDSVEETRRKEALLRPRLRMKGVKVSLRDPEVSLVEGVLARGGRELSDVIEDAWRGGARFGGWSETFDGGVWLRALEESGLDAQDYLRERDPDEALPWDHVDAGPSREFLLEERARALEGKSREDCRTEGCYSCGACGTDALLSSEIPEPRPVDERATGAFRRRARRRQVQNGSPGNRWRVRYAKEAGARFLSHLDLTRAWARAVSSSGLPVVYTQGFNPRPRLSFGPPLPVGSTGEAEFVELELSKAVADEEITGALAVGLPPGLRVLDAAALKSRGSAAAEACAAEYVIDNLGTLEELDEDALAERVSRVRSLDAIDVERGDRVRTLKPAKGVLSAGPEGGKPLRLRVVLELGREGDLRPVDLVGLLYGEDGGEPKLARVHRTTLFRCPSAGGLERMT